MGVSKMHSTYSILFKPLLGRNTSSKCELEIMNLSTAVFRWRTCSVRYG